jgi:hypothetical protein
MAKPALVEVEWIDAIERDESCLLSEVATSRHTQLYRRHTSGYLVHHDDERFVLAREYDPPEPDDEQATMGKFCVIPAGWVKRVRYLTRKPRPAKKGPEHDSAKPTSA